MARGAKCHKWKYIGWHDSRRGAVARVFACVRCGVQYVSNRSWRPGPCLYQQQRIEFEPEGWAAQLRAMNPPRAQPQPPK